jgi:hypothetical protein
VQQQQQRAMTQHHDSSLEQLGRLQLLLLLLV